MEESDDAILRQIREQIAAVDRSIVEALNQRLELVRALWHHKETLGLPMLAPEREEWMTAYLAETNPGPLSDEGLRSFYAELLALTKREVGSAR